MPLIGRRGINLVAGKDQLELEELSRSLNMVSRYGSPLYVRPGQTVLGTTTTEEVHSLARLNDPNSSAFTRLAGVGTVLYRGTTGAFASIDTGYSGDPLTFCPVSMPLSGEPYMAIGDRTRNRKISRTGAIELFGIPPAVSCTTVLGSAAFLSIAEFDTPDGTQSANWTATAGQDRSATPVAAGVPVLSDVPLPTGGNAVQMVTVPGGAATGGYDSIMSIALTRDMTQFSSDPIEIADEDLIHLLLNVSEPLYLEEVKIYFVTSAFTPGAIPGASANNVNAWFKAIRANDFTAFHERQVSSVTASETQRTNELLQQFKQASNVANPNPSDVNSAGITEIGRTVQPQMQPGRNVWFQSGILDAPIRRGDFARVGNDLTTGWDTVTGIVIVVQTNSPTAVLTVQFADWFATGGFGPDTSDPATRNYDYRAINVNPVTGSKGNPSPIQAESLWLNPKRAQVSITPAASGIAELRQRIYRRGGSAPTTEDWHLVGENSADGAAFIDTKADTEILLEETLEIDNDMPVTSTNTSGATVLNQPLSIFFPLENYTFGLGDPLQPGRLYRSKPGFPEAWPADDYRDVCPASEQLLNGGAWANQGFVFSRSRMYSILLAADGSWTSEPTSCAEGLLGRWAMAVTPFGIAFVSPFGVRLTTGGSPDRLSDSLIDPLFEGRAVNGLNAIDLSVASALALAYYDNELWFQYQDSTGIRRHLIWNFFDKTWRPYLFTTEVASVYNEPVEGTAPVLLMGAASSGEIFSHSGFSDDGAAIPFLARTGAWAFGNPRNEKLFAEVVVDGDLNGATLDILPYFNDEATPGTTVSVTGLTGAQRYIFEPFGVVPQRARNVAIELSGDAPTSAALYLHRVGITHQLQPEITLNEPTPWEEMPGGEGYVWGVVITCDTGGTDRTIVVEYTTLNGSVTTAANLTVNANGRKKLPFSFGSILAHQMRLRPIGDCLPWIRYKVEWLTDPEPVRIPGWDTNWESFGTLADKWIKGYIIEADTFGVAKTLVLDVVDALGNQLLAQNTLSLTRPGRGIYQHSFPKIRGRLFRLRATDTNYGKLFKWQPIFDEEPLGLTRWETQERPHQGMSGKWQKPLEGLIAIRSASTVTLTITSYGYGGVVMNTSEYSIPSTGDAKQKVRVPFNAAKGLLFVYLFTGANPFWVYREESDLIVEDWTTGQAVQVPMLPSNDDLDPARVMGNATVAAATPGGS